MFKSILIKSGATVGAAGVLITLGAAPAWAHVTVEPEQATQGDYAKVVFRVPNEKPDAGTVRVKVTFPKDKPLSSVKTTPVPGWSAEVHKVKLDKPVTVSGARVDEAVRSITWTARPGTRIEPDQFEEFEANIGTLPSDVDQFVMPAEQTYDDGEVVKWNAPPAEGEAEPEHPAPAMSLVPEGGAASDAAADSPAPAKSGHGEAETSDDTARWLGGSGLVVGALGLGVGAGSLMRSRKERSS